MAWTKKEQNFLKDLQSEEKLCVEKYQRAAENACDRTLTSLFNEIEKAEKHHYDVVTEMLSGTVPAQKAQQPSQKKDPHALKSTANRAEKQRDAYLLNDLLSTEKYIAGVYNTSVFEFTDPAARNVLAEIQRQEQEHGKSISEYMQANNMSC